MMVADILKAMRAEHIRAGSKGLWKIEKLRFTERQSKIVEAAGRFCVKPGTIYTYLRRYTEATLMEGGEIVMEDTDTELRKHLQFILEARGRVLVTGLGLGCVVRGLLAHGQVESIDVVERDLHVLMLVRQYMPEHDPRLTIHYDDAAKFIQRSGVCWDYAWHDVWSNTDKGEPHLQITHQKFMLALRDRVRVQGAWAFPHHHKRMLRKQLEMDMV